MMQRQFLRTGITLGSFKLDVATVMSQQGEFDPNCHKSLDNDIHTGIDDIDVSTLAPNVVGYLFFLAHDNKYNFQILEFFTS